MGSDLLSKNVGRFGSWIVKRFIKKEEIKDRHLTKIRKNVLYPLLDYIKMEEKNFSLVNHYTSSDDLITMKLFEEINSELFRDALDNHLAELNNFKKILDRGKVIFDRELSKIVSILNLKFGNVFYEDSLGKFFIFESKNNQNIKLEVSYDNLIFGRNVISKSDETNSKLIKDELEKIYSSSIGEKLRKINGRNMKIRKRLITSIERALASENLKGDCEFIK